MSNNLKFALLGASLATITLASISSAVYFYLRYKSTTSFVTPTPTIIEPTSVVSKISTIPSPLPALTSVNTTFSQIKWLDFPKVEKLDLFNFVNDQQDCYKSGTEKYHLVGETEDGAKIYNVYIVSQCGMGDYEELIRFIVYPNGRTYLINRENYVSEELTKILKPNTQTISTPVIGLEAPDPLIIKSKGKFVGPYHQVAGPFNFGPMASILDLNRVSHSLIEETPFGPFYVVYIEDGDTRGLFHRSYHLKHKDNTLSSYHLEDTVSGDDSVPRITWSDGQTNKTLFSFGVRNGGGCGGGRGEVIKDGSSLITNKIQIGTLYDGRSVYQVKDTSSLLVTRLYEGYKVGREETISFSDFANNRNHFIVQDTFGDWSVYTSGDFQSQAECGKPVIYLYPEKPTTVTVKVGANITKSEPTYPKSGWTVLANPNGQLTYQGQSYSSLFWEGTGHGLYPEISNRGFVVAKKDLISTIISHLSQLGLNQQETADFLEFWQPKLPTSPYTRLTWLTTGEMNQLAPLAVSPRPDIAIRIFLDFAPLEKPIVLTPQKLSAPARTGFTLVEWGGLLVK
jgi:hypothetical protein